MAKELSLASTTPTVILAKAVSIVHDVSEGMTVREACKRQFVSATAFRTQLKREPELQTMLDEALKNRDDMLSDMLINIDKEIADARMANVISKNIQWVLERRDPDRFGQRLTVETNIEASRLLAEALSKAVDRIPIPASAPIAIAQLVTDVEYAEVRPDRPATMDELKALGLI